MVNESEIGNIIESSLPKNTVINKQIQWWQFWNFVEQKIIKLMPLQFPNDSERDVEDVESVIKTYNNRLLGMG